MPENERLFRMRLIDLLIELLEQEPEPDERSAEAIGVLRGQRAVLAPAQVVRMAPVVMTATRV